MRSFCHQVDFKWFWFSIFLKVRVISAENPYPMWLYGTACLLGVSEAAGLSEGRLSAMFCGVNLRSEGPAAVVESSAALRSGGYCFVLGHKKFRNFFWIFCFKNFSVVIGEQNGVIGARVGVALVPLQLFFMHWNGLLDIQTITTPGDSRRTLAGGSSVCCDLDPKHGASSSLPLWGSWSFRGFRGL